MACADAARARAKATAINLNISASYFEEPTLAECIRAICVSGSDLRLRPIACRVAALEGELESSPSLVCGLENREAGGISLIGMTHTLPDGSGTILNVPQLCRLGSSIPHNME